MEGWGGQNDPLPISTPSHSSVLNVALHSCCFLIGGGGGGGGEAFRSQRERGGLSLFLGSERRKKNWCANGCLSLFLDDFSSPLLPFPSSSSSLFPSLFSCDLGRRRREKKELSVDPLCKIRKRIANGVYSHGASLHFLFVCAGEPVRRRKPPSVLCNFHRSELTMTTLIEKLWRCKSPQRGRQNNCLSTGLPIQKKDKKKSNVCV